MDVKEKVSERAKELSEYFDERMGVEVIDDEKYKSFMQIFKLTEKLILEKASKWLLEDSYGYIEFHFDEAELNRDALVRDFKRAMKEDE